MTAALIWKDRVQQTVSAVASSGLGAFTLSTASSGYQVLGAADDTKTGYFVATEGTAWESFWGTYTNSGTSLARTTRIDSSTGSGVTFTTAAIVFLDFTAQAAQRTYSSALVYVAGADAATNLAPGFMTVVPAITADRIYTLPTPMVVDDRVGIVFPAGNATLEVIIKTAASQTCDFAGASIGASTEITRIFIAGEVMIFRAVSTTEWIVEYDGRIPMTGHMILTTSSAAEAAATLTYPTAKSGVWTADVDRGSVCTTASDKITARRAGNALFMMEGNSAVAVAIGKYLTLILEINGSGNALLQVQVLNGAAGGMGLSAARAFKVAVDDYVRFQYRTQDGSVGLFGDIRADSNTSFSMTEQL